MLPFAPGSIAFEVWWSSSSITIKTGGGCGDHVPGPTRLGKMSKYLLSSRPCFWKPCSENSGDCHVWILDTDPSPPHSADGSSAADISPGGFSAPGLWKARLDGSLTRVPREQRQLLTLRSHLSSVLVSPSCQRTTVLIRVDIRSAAVG